MRSIPQVVERAEKLWKDQPALSALKGRVVMSGGDFFKSGKCSTGGSHTGIHDDTLSTPCSGLATSCQPSKMAHPHGLY